MYLCYYNCILTKAQSQLIITPSISNLHKPILLKDSVFGVTGLPHRLWKYPHQTSLRPSKGIKGVVWCGLLSTPAQPFQGQARRENKRAETQWLHGFPLGAGTDRLRFQGDGQTEASGGGRGGNQHLSLLWSHPNSFIHSFIHPSIHSINTSTNIYSLLRNRYRGFNRD